MGKKKKLATPKDVSGSGGKSGKTYRRSASTAVDEDTEFFISLAIEHKEEGKKLFKKRDHEGAMLRYGKAINLLPKNHTDVADLRTSIASCYMQMGLSWYPNAISECDLALEASPRYSKALLRRSQCYEALNKLDYAFRDARTVLIMEPKNASANEIFERVKKRLVEEGADVDEMEKNFVSVQPVGAARLRKIVNESGGKDDEPTYDGMNDAETTAEATLNRSIKIQMKAAAITTESAATDVVHDAKETNYKDDLDQEAKDHLLAQEEMDKTKLGLDSLENPKPQPRIIL